MKTFFCDSSWKVLTEIFNMPVHQKSGKTNSRYATFTTPSVGMHDEFLKISPDMIDVCTGKIQYEGTVLLQSQIGYSQSDPTKKIIKILIYPIPEREASHEIELVALENATGINLKPLAEFVNGRRQTYSQICKITRKGIIKETVFSIQLQKLGLI